jgi:hypothetical protein
LDNLSHHADADWVYTRDEEGNWMYDIEDGTDLETRFEAMTSWISNVQFFAGHSFEAIDPRE